MSQIIELKNFDLVVGRCYKIVHRKDSTAPSGMAQIGATKLPSEGIGNTIAARYVKAGGTGKGAYDTGFYVGSPCYRNSKDAKTACAVATKHIMKPYEAKYGENILDNTNYEFWDTLGIDLYEDRVLNTENVDDLFDLYMAILSYELCPIDHIGNPIYRNAQYCVIDLDKATTNTNKVAVDSIDALGNFSAMLKTDSLGAKDLLRYLQVLTLSSDVEDDTVKGMIYNWINLDRENITKFNQAYEMYHDKKLKDVIPLYNKMAKLAKASRLLKRDGGQYYYEGVLLGGDLKTAARQVATNSDMKDIKLAILEAE